jgi:hypothetical protein
VYGVAVSPAVSYRPPSRAMKIREVQFLDPDGDLCDVPRIALEDLPYKVWGFYFVGESVKLLGNFSGFTLRITYYLRPSRLVESVEAGVVLGIVGGVITLNSAAGTNLSAATTVDLLRGLPPFEVVALDVPATVAGSTVTVAAAAIPSGFGPSDFVCRAGESPGVQVHPDLFALVAQSVAVQLLDGNGEDAAYARASRELEKLDLHARSVLRSRVEGEPIPLGAGFSPLWDRGWVR